MLDFLSMSSVNTLDPTITFSRASLGWYYNSAGNITQSQSNQLAYSNQFDNAAWTKSNSFVQTNLLLQSQTFDNASWTKQNISVVADTAIAPDGTLTADRVLNDAVAGQHSLYQTPTLAAGTHTVSVYARADARRRIMVRENTFLGGAGIFDLVSGTVVSSLGGATASITALFNGWYRCTVVNPSLPGGATQWGIFIMPDNATAYADAVYSGDGTGVYLWAGQLVQGSVPGDYRATTSAALPVLYTGPTGLVDAEKLCEDTANAQHRGFQTVTWPVGAETGSIYAKAGERTKCLIDFSDNVTGNAACRFDLVAATATVVLSTGSWTSVSGSITSVGNGWYRCSISATRGAGTQTVANINVCDAGGGSFYTGDGSSGIYISRSMLDYGSTVGAYLDNATASAYYAPRFDYDPVAKTPKGLLIEEARANLLTYSQEFDNAVYSKNNSSVTANQITSPDGTVNADALVRGVNNAAEAMLRVTTTQAISTAYTLSVYAKAGTAGAYLYLRNLAIDGGLPSGLVVFNLANGTIVSNGATYSSPIITSVGNGWYRCAIIGTTPAVIPTNFVDIGVCNASGVVTGLSGDTVNIYGAQLEAGAFATSYIPTVASQVTRAADVASVNTLTPWFNASAGTIVAQYTMLALNTANTTEVSEFSDGTVSNLITLRGNNTAGVTSATATTAGVSQGFIDIPGAAANTLQKTAYTFELNNAASCRNAGAVGTDVTYSMPTGINKLNIGCRVSLFNQLNGHMRVFSYYNTRLPDAKLQALTA